MEHRFAERDPPEPAAATGAIGAKVRTVMEKYRKIQKKVNVHVAMLNTEIFESSKNSGNRRR